MVLFVFQCYPVCNFGEFINFGLGAVMSERAKKRVNVSISFQICDYVLCVQTNTKMPKIFACQTLWASNANAFIELK